MKDNSTSILGIDPGKNGGLALINESGDCEALVKMPATPLDLYNEVCTMKHKGVRMAALEKVGGMPGNGGASMFNFGRNYGHIEMALLAAGIPFTIVTPQKWQKHYQLGSSSGHTKSEWKNRLREAAQRLYPDIKVTLWAADALLIGRYGLTLK